ncbi:hypothetical protein GCM10027612_37530 [Microbispora bryophytorum subsp. camponoti]
MGEYLSHQPMHRVDVTLADKREDLRLVPGRGEQCGDEFVVRCAGALLDLHQGFDEFLTELARADPDRPVPGGQRGAIQRVRGELGA